MIESIAFLAIVVIIGMGVALVHCSADLAGTESTIERRNATMRSMQTSLDRAAKRIRDLEANAYDASVERQLRRKAQAERDEAAKELAHARECADGMKLRIEAALDALSGTTDADRQQAAADIARIANKRYYNDES